MAFRRSIDEWTDPWKELSRVPFTKEKIFKMRLVGDRRGGDNTFDCGIGNRKVRAAEIAGGLPKDELGTGPNGLRQKWRRGRREAE